MTRSDADPEQSARLELAAWGRVLSERGLLTQTSGNLSIRVNERSACITPARLAYDRIEPEDIVLISLEGQVLAGRRPPSSETQLHCMCYRARPDLRAIVHTHSGYATTFAILGMTIPAVHYMIASLRVNEIPLADYATYGTAELARYVSDAFLAPSRAVLLSNHGVVTGGGSLKEAADAAETVEILARFYHRSLQIGLPRVLSEADIAAVMSKQQVAREEDAAAAT